MTNKENQFLLENFKKWMANHSSTSDTKHIKCKRPFVGIVVESKVDTDHLMRKIIIEEGTTEEVVECFLENGGTVTDVDSKNFLIEVETGSFYIHRCYVRKS